MACEQSITRSLRRYGFLILTLLWLTFVQNPRALAQVDEGAINGTITDSTGAVVPNAAITLLNNEQGITLETKSNSAGEYTFSPVRIGTYQVTATAAGFTTTTQKNLVVNVGSQVQANISLTTGASSTTVTVTEAPAQLQTEEASVGQVMTERSINNLPLNGRNFTFLAQLGAGVNSAQADTRGNGSSGAFTANGLRPAQNNYLLDGIDNNSNAVDFLNGTNFVILPPVDAISEFNVQTTDFSAQLGRAAGAVLNATIKSGTNSLHGTVWEFFRNDKLDAADFFETTGKGELRFNQFGASAGGPIVKNKIFFFGDYEGFRRVQGNTQSGVSVPTALERNSGYTNLTDVITGQLSDTGASILAPSNHPRTDGLGRLIPFGTIMDPATTRTVQPGAVDGVTGLRNTSASAVNVRDPFSNGTCNGTTIPYTLSCGLNRIPATRLDPNAIRLLNLYPNPTNGSLSSNFSSSPALYEHRNAFDARGDYNASQSDQVFFRFSYVDDPQFIPGPFSGVADGGAFQDGIQTAKSDQAVLGYTHVFTPNVINVFHAGFNHLHTTRFGPEGSVTGIPEQYGIAGIPQGNGNGGLPNIQISGLSNLGSNDYLPSDEVSQTLQIMDDFTKIYRNHSFKMGVEYQDIHFNTLQPAYSRGEFDFNGNYAGVPNQSGDSTGRAQFLLLPAATTVAGGVSGVGGANDIHASNISKTYDKRTYLALYFQDDIKVNSKLSLNLGLRYDYFSPIAETNGGQANFVQDGPPNGTPTFLYPASGKDARHLSPSFVALAAKDGIAIEATDKYGKGLVQTQQTNFAPRAGFAYQVTPRFVVRGGIGLFFNSFENQGYGPNIGENYPFIYNFNFQGTTDAAPFGTGSNPYKSSSCPGAAVGGTVGSAPIGAGLSCVEFTADAVNASGLGLQGLQFNFKTPRTLSSNLSFQYAITHTLSAQVAYVLTDASNLQVGIGNNTPTTLVPAAASLTPTATQATSYIPFPDFGENGSYQRTAGNSIYNGLQTKLEQTLSNGLNFLATYTYSKTLTDAGDLLNGGSVSGFRAPNVPGFGPRFDWGLASFDIRNVVHISGGYELPFGRKKKFLGDSSKLVDNVIGGWSLNTIVTLQNGQPLGFGCPTSTTNGTGCNDILVPGQNPKLGVKLRADANGQLQPFWISNAKAFQQPCTLGLDGSPISGSPTGCIPLTGAGLLGGGPSTTYGPGFHRWDLSAFKGFQINDRVSVQFRAEFFNILNHPNFNAPNFGGNGVQAISNSGNFNSSAFSQIGSTRDAPFDPRQIQFALKLYY